MEALTAQGESFQNYTLVRDLLDLPPCARWAAPGSSKVVLGAVENNAEEDPSPEIFAGSGRNPTLGAWRVLDECARERSECAFRKSARYRAARLRAFPSPTGSGRSCFQRTAPLRFRVGIVVVDRFGRSRRCPAKMVPSNRCAASTWCVPLYRASASLGLGRCDAGRSGE